MKNLTLSAGSFDHTNTYNLAVTVGKRTRKLRVKLHSGYQTAGDGIYWLMQCGNCIADSYTAEEAAERMRLQIETPLVAGEHVSIDGKQYSIIVRGDFSDAAVLRAV